MSKIKVQRQVDHSILQQQEIHHWPVWSKEASTFPWHYHRAETCYFIEGEVIVTPDGGEAVTMGTGDIATFPAGMSCTWEIRQAVKKHYQFG